jgi:hypothetical protein
MLLLLGFDCFWLKLPVLMAVVLGQLLLQFFLVEVQVMYLLPAFLEELPLPPADSSEAVHSVGSTLDLLYQQPYLFPQVNNILPFRLHTGLKQHKILHISRVLTFFTIFVIPQVFPQTLDLKIQPFNLILILLHFILQILLLPPHRTV